MWMSLAEEEQRSAPDALIIYPASLSIVDSRHIDFHLVP